MLTRYSGCGACGLPNDCAQGSLALHSSGVQAVVTCFHGPVHLAKQCKCGSSTLMANGEIVTVLEEIEDRDVAWLKLPTPPIAPPSAPVSGGTTGPLVPLPIPATPPTPPTPRACATVRPVAGQRVTVELPTGDATAVVIAVTGRDFAADPRVEIALDRTFHPGDSGSPVMNAAGEVVAVVRNVCGRCGLV